MINTSQDIANLINFFTLCALIWQIIKNHGDVSRTIKNNNENLSLSLSENRKANEEQFIFQERSRRLIKQYEPIFGNLVELALYSSNDELESYTALKLNFSKKKIGELFFALLHEKCLINKHGRIFLIQKDREAFGLEKVSGRNLVKLIFLNDPNLFSKINISLEEVLDGCFSNENFEDNILRKYRDFPRNIPQGELVDELFNNAKSYLGKIISTELNSIAGKKLFGDRFNCNPESFHSQTIMKYRDKFQYKLEITLYNYTDILIEDISDRFDTEYDYNNPNNDWKTKYK